MSEIVQVVQLIVVVAGMLGAFVAGAWVYQRGLANLPLAPTGKFPHFGRRKRNTPVDEARREENRF